MQSNIFTCVEWLNYYKEEVEKIKDSSPLLMVLCVAVGIEYLGKLLSKESLDSSNSCSEKFEEALSQFESLNKYCNKNFYNLIRCGLAHRITVKEGIILTRDKHTRLVDSPVVLNVYEFFNDFATAVNEAQERKEWTNSLATTDYVSITETSETGTTTTILYYE